MARVGVYTTVRVCEGRPLRLAQHAARLARDAERLGLPQPDRLEIEAQALAAVGERLGPGSGVLRIEWSQPEAPGGAAGAGLRGAERARAASAFALLATIRPLGPEPRTWRAATAKTQHPGPEDRNNTKAIDVPAWDAARAEREAAGVDEMLLFDRAGRLVEGSRTNLIVVGGDGGIRTPARRLGPVEGLGLEIVRASLGPETLRESDTIGPAALRDAAELIAVNAVRGAVAIVELDGSPIAEGREGAIALRLRSLFAGD